MRNNKLELVLARQHGGFTFQPEENIVLYRLTEIEEDIEKIKPRIEEF